jgi:hypothetical protein
MGVAVDEQIFMLNMDKQHFVEYMKKVFGARVVCASR